MPSKALLRAGTLLRAGQHVDGAGEAITGELDVPAVLGHRDWSPRTGRRQTGRMGQRRRDHADPRPRPSHRHPDDEVAGDGSTTAYTARHAVALCTGSTAMLPDIPGRIKALSWMSKEATSAQQIPGRLAILGGGVAAAEMATAYATLGTDVTVIARGGLLEHSEPFAGELVGDALGNLGVTIRSPVPATSVQRLNCGAVDITCDDGTTLDQR